MILTWWWSISSLEKGRIKLQRECQTEWNWSTRAEKGSLSMGWMEIGTLISIAPRGAKKVPNIGRRLVAISALLWSATSSPRGQKLQVLGSAAAAGKRLPFLPRPAGRKQYFSRNWAHCSLNKKTQSGQNKTILSQSGSGKSETITDCLPPISTVSPESLILTKPPIIGAKDLFASMLRTCSTIICQKERVLKKAGGILIWSRQGSVPAFYGTKAIEK